MNVVPLPIKSLNDIPAQLRQFADDIDADLYGAAKTVIVVLETEENMHCFGWGGADDPLRNAGLLDAAKGLQLELAFPDWE